MKLALAAAILTIAAAAQAERPPVVGQSGVVYQDIGRSLTIGSDGSMQQRVGSITYSYGGTNNPPPNNGTAMCQRSGTMTICY